MSNTATIPQQRALAYAPKPFAALSILSSIYVFYYLLKKHPEKRERMYHRLVFAAFANVFVLSICIFWGSWALPTVCDFVGSAGNMTTCVVQGVFFLTVYLALAAYYASFGLYGLVAVKNNFHQEKIKWLEKYIHLWAYVPPVTILVLCGVLNMSTPGEPNPFCSITRHRLHYDEPTKKNAVIGCLVLVYFLIGTCSILHLWFNFSKIQNQVDEAAGMRRLIESARKRRNEDVAEQTGLYLFLFSYGYFLPLIAMSVNMATQATWVYYMNMVGACMSASQGVVFMVIYFLLQKPDLELKDLSGYFADKSDRHYQNTTVSDIRENAKRMKRRITSLPPLSFRIFDGEPAEDSPWAQFFEDDSTEDDETFIRSIQEQEIDHGLMTSLL